MDPSLAPIPQDLLNAPTVVEANPPVETRAQHLPFNEISWQNFERLCVRMLQARSTGEVRMFGVQGDAQHGIDLFTMGETGRYIVCQCKNVEQFGPTDITQAVHFFLAGIWADRTERFILAAANLRGTAQQGIAIAECEILLKEKGIEFEIWGADRLGELLKADHATVADFFGAEWTRIFCGNPERRQSLAVGLSSEEIARAAALTEAMTGGHESDALQREELATVLEAFSIGHGIVVGEPGGGKSHVLRRLLRSLAAEGAVVIPVLVSNLTRADNPELQSVYEYPEEDFVAFLRRAGGSEGRCVVVFDGFDAARDPSLRRTLIALVRRCLAELERWTVLLSARTFEARHSSDLLGIFPKRDRAEGHGAYELAEVGTRHFLVPPLSRQEVLDALEREPGTFRNVQPSDELIELIRVPFNYQLLVSISASNGDMEKAAKFGSAVELLDEYWRLKVEGTPEYVADQDSLTLLVKKMLSDRALVISRRSLPPSYRRETEMRLLSEGVLVEFGGMAGKVSFRHNILYDYAVQALILSDDPRDLAGFIQEDETRALLLRPSLAMLFERLWTTDRALFWGCYHHLRTHASPVVRFCGNLVPAAVVAQHASGTDDLDLLKKVKDYAPAVATILRSHQALRLQINESWRSLLVELSLDPQPELVNELVRAVRRMLDEGCDNADVRRATNEIGRSLLSWAHLQDTGARANADRFARAWIVPLILDTLDVELEANRMALQPILDSIGQPSMMLGCVDALCDGVGTLALTLPDLAAKLYKRVFGYKETSAEATVLTSGVLTLTSNRAQDYQMCRYQLGQAYSGFLAASPELAVEAGTSALAAHLAEDRRGWMSDRAPKVELARVVFPLIGDMGALSRPYGHEEITPIANAMSEWLGSPERTPEDAAKSVDSFAAQKSSASLYALLLESASRNPGIYAAHLRDFASSKAALSSGDLFPSARKFLAALLLELDGDGRQRLLAVTLAAIVTGRTRRRWHDERAWRNSRTMRLKLQKPAKSR